MCTRLVLTYIIQKILFYTSPMRYEGNRITFCEYISLLVITALLNLSRAVKITSLS